MQQQKQWERCTRNQVTLALEIEDRYNPIESVADVPGESLFRSCLPGGAVFPADVVAKQLSFLDSSVLMLNAHYAALRVVSARRAFSLLFKRDANDEPIAEVISIESGRYVSYDFEDWAQLSSLRHEFERGGHDWIRSVRRYLVVPRIIRVLSFARVPRQHVKFNRRNLLARDGHTCQYCGQHFPTSELSLDHVIPRTQGGETTWENIVCACVECNVRKGGRTPAQAGVKLLKKPVKPRRNPAIRIQLADERFVSWKQFLDRAYWDVELK